MGMLERADALEAAEKAGALADQRAIIDAVKGDAFERDVDKVYEFRVVRVERYFGLRA